MSGDADGVDDMVQFGADMGWPGSGQTRGCFCSYDGFLPHQRCAVQPLDIDDDEYGDGMHADWVQPVAYRRHDFEHEGCAGAVDG